MGQRGFLRLAFVIWALNALLPIVAILYTSVTPSVTHDREEAYALAAG